MSDRFYYFFSVRQVPTVCNYECTKKIYKKTGLLVFEQNKNKTNNKRKCCITKNAL